MAKKKTNILSKIGRYTANTVALTLSLATVVGGASLAAIAATPVIAALSIATVAAGLHQSYRAVRPSKLKAKGIMKVVRNASIMGKMAIFCGAGVALASMATLSAAPVVATALGVYMAAAGGLGLVANTAYLATKTFSSKKDKPSRKAATKDNKKAKPVPAQSAEPSTAPTSQPAEAFNTQAPENKDTEEPKPAVPAKKPDNGPKQ